MGESAREKLSSTLGQHLNTLYETLQIFDQTPGSSLQKVSWKEVIQIGEQVSKQATTVGMLYTGETPEVKALEENMSAYFNILQGFILLCHGSEVGAGPTLNSCINKTVKQVVDSSFLLLREAVTSYGSPIKDQKRTIPPLVGAVWDACSALKKTPATNITAIGRAMTQVTVSMKDVLREMMDLKSASPTEEASSEAATKVEEDASNDDNDSCGGDLGTDLSPEEMKVAKLATSIVSDTLLVIKELIRCITSLLKQENSDSSAISVDSLEKLLKFCQGIGEQVDELGACLYPPQEISAIKLALEKISSFTTETETELKNLHGFTDDFVKVCAGLRSSLRRLESELGRPSTGDLAPLLDNLVI